MRIAATSTGTTVDSAVDPKFGRCQHFLFIDTDGSGVEHLSNPYRSASTGTGPRCAQLLVDRHVEVLLSGDVGPKARRALEAAGIRVVTGCSGTVAEAVAELLAPPRQPT